MTSITSGVLVEQLASLGVRHGGVLVVQMSFRAARPVEGSRVL